MRPRGFRPLMSFTKFRTTNICWSPLPCIYIHVQVSCVHVKWALKRGTTVKRQGGGTLINPLKLHPHQAHVNRFRSFPVRIRPPISNPTSNISPLTVWTHLGGQCSLTQNYESRTAFIIGSEGGREREVNTTTAPELEAF